MKVVFNLQKINWDGWNYERIATVMHWKEDVDKPDKRQLTQKYFDVLYESCPPFHNLFNKVDTVVL